MIKLHNFSKLPKDVCLESYKVNDAWWPKLLDRVIEFKKKNDNPAIDMEYSHMKMIDLFSFCVTML